MEGLLAGCCYAYFAKLTCSSPPVSPVLFKWLINKPRGDSDESRANNSIANTGISSPRLSIEYKWTAASYINSLVASRILNSSVSWLSKDRVDSILSGWPGRSHILLVCKVNYNHITRLWMEINEMTHTLDIHSRKLAAHVHIHFWKARGSNIIYVVPGCWKRPRISLGWFLFPSLEQVICWQSSTGQEKNVKYRSAKEKSSCSNSDYRLKCRFGRHFLIQAVQYMMLCNTQTSEQSVP